MTLTVLRAGLDTVEESYRGQFSEEAIERLDQAKALAMQKDSPVRIDGGLTELFMHPRAFGHWRWRISDPRLAIVAKKSSAPGTAIAQVRYSAFGLANEDALLLAWLARQGLASLGTFEPLAISRADVCADFQGWVPTPQEMRNVVCPASYRATHGTEKQAQTFQFGKKTLLRLYNKSAELEVSKKLWLPDLWKQDPAFTPDQDVWRSEYQAADSQVLKQLGIHTFEQLVEKKSALLDFGLTWAQLRSPTQDRTKTRWPEDPRWTALREAVFSGSPLQRRIAVPELMTLDAVMRRLVGLAATAGAYFGTDNYLIALQKLSFATEVHMMHEDVDFAALVEEKRCRLLSKGV